MRERTTMNRRNFLRNSATVSLGLVAGPATLSLLAGSGTAAAAPTLVATGLPLVDDYTTNIPTNLTPETNAVVRILSGFQRIWSTGATWDTGTPLMPEVLRANVRFCEAVTAARTEAEAKLAFIYDRQHQSYAAIGGLGPLADLYKAGAMAVTGITTAPDGTPPSKISDALPADAPPGSALGAGSTSSALGLVAQLVDTVRGPFASSNPSKFAYQYPRPWRLDLESRAVDTGAVDALGYPVYDSDVIVAPQLLRQRSTAPVEDGGFPSGHANAFYLACLALAYAIPERFQELVARAAELSHSRIVAGMHSPVDVIGGRTMATALAAAALYDPANATLKAAARAQAAAYLQAQTGTTADTLYAYAHSATVDTDPYADREANRRTVTPQLTYILARTAERVEMTVPKGAEVLLETRLPYLDAEQRREVLRTTALPAGYVLLDGPEQWGRLDLFTAADGYRAFAADVHVTMNAGDGGFSAADAWRNDIDGPGGLVKLGTGALTLTGANRYAGGTCVAAGTLVAGSPKALGRGPVQVRGGVLRLAAGPAGVRVRGRYTQGAAGVLEVTLCADGVPALIVSDTAVLDRSSTLTIALDPASPPPTGRLVPVLLADRLRGRFKTITVTTAGLRAVPVYKRDGLYIRLRAA